MSALKFTCPSCGQHMQCEKAYVGHQIPCPSCGAQLRVPVSDAAGGGPNALPRAELVVATEPPGIPTPKSAASEIPQEIVVQPEPKKFAPPTTAGQVPEIHCECPVCHSELKVPYVPSGAGHPQVAELVHAPPANPAASAEAPPISGETPLSERERQIAAARAAHPVEIHPAIKPRLSYVMNGGAAPAESENSNSDTRSHSE